MNLLVVDLFPPTPRDPQGIHKAIWDELGDEPFELPPGKPLTVASYLGGDIPTAYVESVGVGDTLPSLPIFLSETRYIPAPLETTYQEAWAVFPDMLKELIEPTGDDDLIVPRSQVDRTAIERFLDGVRVGNPPFGGSSRQSQGAILDRNALP